MQLFANYTARDDALSNSVSKVFILMYFIFHNDIHRNSTTIGYIKKTNNVAYIVNST